MEHTNNTLKLTLASVVALGGCTAVATEDASVEEPGVELNGLTEQQKITSVNSDGTWTANASVYANWGGGPVGQTYAYATFTGPAGKTRQMGLCLLRKHLPQISCTSDGLGTPTNGSCNSAPAGWGRYCLGANGSSSKYCYYKPAADSSVCAGSPLTQGPIAPGTYYSTSQQAGYGTVYMSYACFEKCSSIPGSTSANGTVQ